VRASARKSPWGSPNTPIGRCEVTDELFSAATVVVEPPEESAARSYSGGGTVGHKIRGYLPPIAVLGVVCGLWELIVRVSHTPIYLVPTFSAVVKAMFTQAGTLLPQSWVTIEEVLSGFAISIVIGIPLAVVIVSFRAVERALYPLLVSSQVVPKVALAPLFIVWFGLGLLPKIIMVFLISFFPIVISTAVGLRSVELEKLYLARSMGASKLQTLVRFRLPHSLPSMFGGIKLAATFSVIGAIVGEFVSSSRGLGYVIQNADANLDTVTMFAGIGYLTIIGMLMFLAVEVAERLMLPWHVSRREGTNSGS
jgi:NitT/TauT family transport system permease protein